MLVTINNVIQRNMQESTDNQLLWSNVTGINLKLFHFTKINDALWKKYKVNICPLVFSNYF